MRAIVFVYACTMQVAAAQAGPNFLLTTETSDYGKKMKLLLWLTGAAMAVTAVLDGGCTDASELLLVP